MTDWHNRTVDDLLVEFSSDAKYGKKSLSDKREKSGANRFFHHPTADTYSAFRAITRDGAVILLIITYIILALINSLYEAIIGTAVLCFFAAVAVIRIFVSRKRIENSYKLLLPSPTVLDRGKNKRLSIYDVEVGDIVVFKQGDIIPADGRIIESDSLKIAERFVDPRTGRVDYRGLDKNADVFDDGDESRNTYPNMVYAGSVVISGSGKMLVTAIGADTRVSVIHSGITLVGNHDLPDYLVSFNKKNRRFSLAVLISVIPVTLIGLWGQTASASVSGGREVSLLYYFLISLCAAVTSMSELIISPTESLVTGEFLPNIKTDSSDRIKDSCVTKLASAVDIADADILLILCPEVLYDRKRTVRRIYTSDRFFRGDMLDSKDLDDLLNKLYSFSSSLPLKYQSADIRIIKNYFSPVDEEYPETEYRKDYPVAGCIARVSRREGDMQFSCIGNSADILNDCAFFRGENGLSEFDAGCFQKIVNAIDEFHSSGHTPYLFCSLDRTKNGLVFEGLIGVGCEYPYVDGELAEVMNDCGLTPILVLPEETPENISFAHNCGLIKSDAEIAVASEYMAFRRTVNDAPDTVRIFIGFGRRGTSDLVKRYTSLGKCILPIIKDSSNRREISPLKVYATHTAVSHDSVRLGSSLGLLPVHTAQAERRTKGANIKGGLSDAFAAVLGCSMARLKLGMYANVLMCLSLMRICSVYLPLIFGYNDIIPWSPLILLFGLLSDMIALSVISHAKGVPVRSYETQTYAKNSQSTSVLLICAIVGGLISALTVFLSRYLSYIGYLPKGSGPTFLMLSLFLAQLTAIGAFLLHLARFAKHPGINWLYVLYFVLSLTAMCTVGFLPDEIKSFVFDLGVYLFDISFVPLALVPSVIAFGSVFAVGKLFSDLSARPRA